MSPVNQFFFLYFALHSPAYFSSNLILNYGFWRELVAFPGWEISPDARLQLTQDIKHKEETGTDIHSSSGIRNHVSSVWLGEEISCVKLCCECDWHLWTKDLNEVQCNAMWCDKKRSDDWGGLTGHGWFIYSESDKSSDEYYLGLKVQQKEEQKNWNVKHNFSYWMSNEPRKTTFFFYKLQWTPKFTNNQGITVTDICIFVNVFVHVCIRSFCRCYIRFGAYPNYVVKNCCKKNLFSKKKKEEEKQHR
jgi:hypothetical protein